MLTQTGGTLGDAGRLQPVHRREALPHPGGGRRARVLRPADADAAGRRHVALRVHVVRALQRPVPSRGADRRSQVGRATPRAWRSAPGETWDARGARSSTSGPRSRRGCSRDSATASRRNHPPLPSPRSAADRLVLVVLLRPARHRAAGARQPRRHRQEHPRRSRYVQIDDGYQTRDGRLARDRRGVRRQRADACSTRSARAASSRRSGSRRSSPKQDRTCSSSTPTGSSRTRTARRCDPIA